MQLTAYHAKYAAHDLTKQAPPGAEDQLSMSLFDASVDLNPHQIEAAMFALQSPLSEGAILADEVGLGKTIGAGIVLCQKWAERKRRLIIICPASIRQQWANELSEKFNLPAIVIDARTYRALRREGHALYLLRNADTQAKGLGFARAGNFYPDFLLWLVDDVTGQQWLSFVDPKGIRNLDLNDPKLGLYAEIKERQKELDDPDLVLNAFILSYTQHGDLLNVGSAGSKAELEDRHVLFMDDGRDTYLGKLFERIAA